MRHPRCTPRRTNAQGPLLVTAEAIGTEQLLPYDEDRACFLEPSDPSFDQLAVDTQSVYSDK